MMADLEEDAQKFAETYVQSGAEEMARQISDFTEMALEIFYGSYNPKIYDRENNIRNNTYKPIIEVFGTEGTGGVELSSADMHEYWRGKLSTDEIFDRVINRGLHGTKETKPPYDIIEQFASGSAFANYINRYAFNAARSQSYKLLKF